MAFCIGKLWPFFLRTSLVKLRTCEVIMFLCVGTVFEQICGARRIDDFVHCVCFVQTISQCVPCRTFCVWALSGASNYEVRPLGKSVATASLLSTFWRPGRPRQLGAISRCWWRHGLGMAQGSGYCESHDHAKLFQVSVVPVGPVGWSFQSTCSGFGSSKLKLTICDSEAGKVSSFTLPARTGSPPCCQAIDRGS